MKCFVDEGKLFREARAAVARQPNIMNHGRVMAILDRLQERLTNDPDEFERTLDKIDGIL